MGRGVWGAGRGVQGAGRGPYLDLMCVRMQRLLLYSASREPASELVVGRGVRGAGRGARALFRLDVFGCSASCCTAPPGSPPASSLWGAGRGARGAGRGARGAGRGARTLLRLDVCPDAAPLAVQRLPGARQRARCGARGAGRGARALLRLDVCPDAAPLAVQRLPGARQRARCVPGRARPAVGRVLHDRRGIQDTTASRRVRRADWCCRHVGWRGTDQRWLADGTVRLLRDVVRVALRRRRRFLLRQINNVRLRLRLAARRHRRRFAFVFRRLPRGVFRRRGAGRGAGRGVVRAIRVPGGSTVFGLRLTTGAADLRQRRHGRWHFVCGARSAVAPRCGGQRPDSHGRR